MLVAGCALPTEIQEDMDKSPEEVHEDISNNQLTIESDNSKIFDDADLAFKFEYRLSPNGYILEESPVSANDDPDLKKALLLIRIKDSEEMKAATGPREGTPSIGILVFGSTTQGLKEWLLKKSGFSNYTENSEEEIQIDGKRALYYEWEGLYDGKTIAFKHNDNIFLITGTFYNQTVDDRQADFVQVLESIELY